MPCSKVRPSRPSKGLAGAAAFGTGGLAGFGEGAGAHGASPEHSQDAREGKDNVRRSKIKEAHEINGCEDAQF